MRLEYAISQEDYLKNLPRFAARPGRGVYFKLSMAVCVGMVGLGAFAIHQGMGFATGGFLMALGVAAAGAAYLYDKRSVRKTKERFEQNQALAYRRLHCVDRRVFEWDQAGFTASCACGSTTRPWSELIQCVETSNLFLLVTKGDQIPVFKSAFAGEADITEFRAAILEKLNAGRTFSSPSLEFVYSAQDLREGRWLHIVSGGGWRRLATQAATFVCCVWGSFVIWNYVSRERNPLVLVGLLALAGAGPVSQWIRARKRMQRVPQILFFGDEGLHFQSGSVLARTPWTQYIGYLESDSVFVLYSSPVRYRTIPKRVLNGSEERFRNLLAAKLPKFDYRAGGTAAIRVPGLPQRNTSK